MKFDGQGRLVSPSGAPAFIGTPIAVDLSGGDDEEVEEENGAQL
jgi:hypothetical protein